MDGPLQEKDWKTMRSMKDELLQELCSRINQQSKQILKDETKTEHLRYGDLYGHIKVSNQIIADCFDDWRRSRLSMKILSLRHHKLLTDEHVKKLTESGQEWLTNVEKTFR